MKKWLGRIMIFAPFVGIFSYVAYMEGIGAAIIGAGIVVTLIGWIIVSVWLLDS